DQKNMVFKFIYHFNISLKISVKTKTVQFYLWVTVSCTNGAFYIIAVPEFVNREKIGTIGINAQVSDPCFLSDCRGDGITDLNILRAQVCRILQPKAGIFFVVYFTEGQPRKGCIGIFRCPVSFMLFLHRPAFKKRHEPMLVQITV